MRFEFMPVKPARGISLAFIILLIVVLPVSAITLTPGTSSSSSNTISNGDPVYVTGVATGHPNNGLQVWLIGYNMVKVSTISVNSDNSYQYEITKAETQNLASGQYLVIVQHPMMNGQFDIIYSPSTGQVINRQMSSAGSSSGTAIFQLTNAGSLQSTNSASALMAAINSQNIDDTFATATFYISPPNAFIHPVGDHVVGEKFTISGTTNLAVGDKLQVDVYSSSFSPTKKSQSGEFTGASGIVEVRPGNGSSNQWSFDVDASGFKPDEYIVTVTGIIQDVKGSSTFNIFTATTTTTAMPAAVGTSAPVSLGTTMTTVELTPAVVPTTHQSSLPIGIIIVGITLTGLFLVRKKE